MSLVVTLQKNLVNDFLRRDWIPQKSLKSLHFQAFLRLIGKALPQD
jgi:hypothetical protein